MTELKKAIETRETMFANTKSLMNEWKVDDMIKHQDKYKMNSKDFDLWLEYLNTQPTKPTYREFREYKAKRREEIK